LTNLPCLNLKNCLMPLSINRRAWIKRSAMLAGGTALVPSVWNQLSATPLPPEKRKFISDIEYARLTPPDLKARLFANENPFGPSEKAKKAIADIMDVSYRYPFMYEDELMEKIASSHSLKPRMVQLGAGSTSLLFATAMYFSKNGGNVISGDPSYDDLPDRTAEFGCKWNKIPLTADYKLDLDAMEKAVDASTRLVYICNPNNPTGTTVDIAKLRAFCERVSKKTTVFIDEAYIDYLPDPKAATMIDLVKTSPNIIVARTFSKLHGFAGLRVGYLLADETTLKHMRPYCIGQTCLSATSLKAAIASYDDAPFLAAALQKTNVSKNFLYKTLKEQGYEYIVSDTNFVLFPIKMEGQRFIEELFKRGVGVRQWKFNNKHWCRVSIGRMDEMEAFANAFKEIS
jgi:histidinol-phosphate aminotransferase